MCNQQKEKRKHDRKTQCRSARTCKRLIRGWFTDDGGHIQFADLLHNKEVKDLVPLRQYYNLPEIHVTAIVHFNDADGK